MRAFSLRVLLYLLLIAGLFQLAAIAMRIWGWDLGRCENTDFSNGPRWRRSSCPPAWRSRWRGNCQGRSFYLFLVVLFAAAEFREFDDSRAYHALWPARWVVFVLAGSAPHAVLATVLVAGRPASTCSTDHTVCF